MGRFSSSRLPARSRRGNFRKGAATEVTIELLVNGVLLAAAVSTLIKLLPYYFSQSGKLEEVRLEVTRVRQRVDNLQENFKRNFAPEQTKVLMQEQSSRIESDQIRVFLLEPNRQEKNQN